MSLPGTQTSATTGPVSVTASWLMVPVADSVLIGTIRLVAWGIAASLCPTCLGALPSVLLGGFRAGRGSPYRPFSGDPGRAADCGRYF